MKNARTRERIIKGERRRERRKGRGRIKEQ